MKMYLFCNFRSNFAVLTLSSRCGVKSDDCALKIYLKS